MKPLDVHITVCDVHNNGVIVHMSGTATETQCLIILPTQAYGQANKLNIILI